MTQLLVNSHGNAHAHSIGTNKKTACTKTHAMKLGCALSCAAEAERLCELLCRWENQAPKYNRQSHHVSLEVIDGQEPPYGLVAAQFLDLPRPKRGEVLTDVELDGGDQHGSSSSSSSSSNL